MLRQLSLSAFLILLPTVPLVAQDSPLKLFGSNVDAIIRIAEPDKSIESVVQLVNGAQPGFGEIARGAINENLGNAISNPELTGADLSRDWHVGVYKGEGEPQVVFVIPAVETADFVAALGEDFKSKVEGNYVLYTDKGELPELPTAENSALKSIDEKSQAALKSGEIGLYLNSKHLNTAYREEIETAHDQVLEGLNQLRFAIPQDSGVNIAPVIEMYGTMAEKLFQGIKDSEAFVLAIDLGAEGVRIEEYIDFGKSTKSARELGQLKTSDMADMTRLPADAIAYYGVSGGMKELVKWSVELTAEMAEDQESSKKIKDAFTSLDEIEFGSIVGSLKIGDLQSGTLQAVGIAEIKPVDKMKEYMRSSIEAMSALKMPGITQTSKLTEEAEEYGDLKADIITVKQEFDETLPQAEMQRKLQEIMFGQDGMQTRVIYLDEEYVTILGGGKEAAQKTIDSLSSTNNTSLDTPRKVMMDQLNVIGLIDIPGLIGSGLKVASELEELQLPIDSQMIDNLNLQRSFIGFGIATEENALRCRTDIPMQQIQGIFKISMLFAGMRNQL